MEPRGKTTLAYTDCNSVTSGVLAISTSPPRFRTSHATGSPDGASSAEFVFCSDTFAGGMGAGGITEVCTPLRPAASLGPRARAVGSPSRTDGRMRRVAPDRFHPW